MGLTYIPAPSDDAIQEAGQKLLRALGWSDGDVLIDVADENEAGRLDMTRLWPQVPILAPAKEALDELGTLCTKVLWWPNNRVELHLTPRPAEWRDEMGRLHHDTEFAVIHRSGVGEYWYHGINIPAALWNPPVVLAELLRTRNAEVRRAVIERHGGLGEMLRAVQPTQQDTYGTLYRVSYQSPRLVWGRDRWKTTQRYMTFVRVRNATSEPNGTRREYVLAVPNTCRTAHQAVAWTFGKTSQTYRPEVET